MLKLFNVDYQIVVKSSDVLTIYNPLGKVTLELVFDTNEISKNPPSFMGEISDHSQICIWDFKDFHAELLKTEVQPSLPAGMRVDRCIALIWRFKCLSKKIDLKFSCALSFNESNYDRDIEPGERLICMSWANKNSKLSIGTEDEESLHSRAENQNSLPIRLAIDNLIHPDSIKYLEDGLLISIPTLLENEEGQIQFVISWVSGKDSHDLSTWYAVDIPPFYNTY